MYLLEENSNKNNDTNKKVKQNNLISDHTISYKHLGRTGTGSASNTYSIYYEYDIRHAVKICNTNNGTIEVYFGNSLHSTKTHTVCINQTMHGVHKFLTS